MTQFLPPNLLALFAARDPIPYLPPADKLPHEKKSRGYAGVGQFLSHFEDPKDTPLPVRLETRDERLERKRRERAENAAYKLEQGIALWNPSSYTTATTDPYKTLFVARVNYDTTESKLRREFEAYGPIKKIILVSDKVSGKPRGYAFIEFEHEREMHSAYKHADGKKIDGRRVLVDVERGRTVKGWLPRRLGGGLGGTRKGAPDENIRHSGRDDARSVERDSNRYDAKESHRHSRDRSERKRSRSREREKRRRSKSPKERETRDRERDRERGDRDRRSRTDRDGRRGERSRRGDNAYPEEPAGGDVPDRRPPRGESRDKDLDKHRKRRRSRSHSRDRKRSHRNDYDNNRGDKLEPIKEGLRAKEEVSENGLYGSNTEAYADESFPQAFNENSNSSSFDQFAAQNYSQPTYVNPYNNKDQDLYSP